MSKTTPDNDTSQGQRPAHPRRKNACPPHCVAVNAHFAIEPLSKAHDRSDFTSGNIRIDAYFLQAVSQDVRRDYAACFVARELSTD